MRAREFITESQEVSQQLNNLIGPILNAVPQTEEIWFYGSRARGNNKETSDWDILVIIPKEMFGTDFQDVQSVLDNLSQNFSSAKIRYDIQAGHSGIILHDKADQEGRLLWKRADTITESWQFRNKNKIYEPLVNTIDSGPFDGGCVVFAQALQLKYGGEIVVLVNKDGEADHAALMLNGRLIDADGAAPVNQFITRFIRNEKPTLLYDSIIKIRAIEDHDLPDAPRNRKLAERIAALL